MTVGVDQRDIDAILRAAADAPLLSLMQGARIPTNAMPLGPARVLWSHLQATAARGVTAPLAPADVIDALGEAGVPPNNTAAWWESLRARTADIEEQHFEMLAKEVADSYARATVLGTLETALDDVRREAASRAPAHELLAMVRAAVDAGEHECPADGLVDVVTADMECQRREALAASTGGSTGLTTGIPDLDAAMNPLSPGQLTVVAARAKVGKTHAAVHLVGHATSRNWPHLGDRPAGALIASLEMDAASVLARLLAWESETDYAAAVRSGSAGESEAIADARLALREREIAFLDTPSVTVATIRAAARARSRSHPLDLLVVDYLDLVRPVTNQRERHDLQVGQVVRDLLYLGKELGIHVLLLVQVNREGQEEATIRHLANSDEIGRAAHNVLILNRDRREDPLGALARTSDAKPHARLCIDVTTRGPGTGARIAAILDKSTSRFLVQPNAASSTADP